MKNKLLYILIFFGIIYALISLVNHYCFRTYALDLGVYTNALYDYIHFKFNDSSVFKESPENLLADHFDLYLIIFSPVSFIFKIYTLLVIQIISILLGGYGIYKYFENRTSTFPYFQIIMTISFLLFYGIYSALSYDYHSNVVAAMLVPFLFLFIRQYQWTKAFVILVFICIAKENISMWMSFIFIGLMIEYRNNIDALKYLTAFLIFSIAYFLLVTQIIMPHLSNEGKFYQFKYSVLGKDYLSAVYHIITHPLECLKVFFINHTNEPKANFVKAELHIFIFLSGLWALIFKPSYLIMLLPIYTQKLFHDNYLMWGIDTQYSIEFAPILIIGAGEFFLSLKNQKWQIYLSLLLLLLNLTCTIRLMDRTILFTNKSRIRIYQSSHYQRNFELKNVYDALNIIPDTAVASAQTSILPHLALRDKIYTFPIIKDAQYIILNTKDDTYPLDTNTYKMQVNQLIQDTAHWKILFQKNSVLVLNKR